MNRHPMMALHHLSLLLCASSSIASAFVGPSSINSARLTTSSSWKEHNNINKIGRSINCPQLHMVEDEDENNPLARGINSVGWLPSVFDASPSRSVFDSSMSSDDDDEETTETLPLFPLGGVVYTPNSEHILNIFEPRYRQMYNDILMNGSKRFVVSMSHPNEEGRFAQVGVLFSLEELKEVSEMTADQVKYICNHRVTGRVKLHKVLNPEAWESRDTYLKVKGTIIDDTGLLDEEKNDNDSDEAMDESIPQSMVAELKKAAAFDAMEKSPEEEALLQSFSDLVELQHDLTEDVRFTRASVKSFGVAAGTEIDPNLWTSIRLWQSYAEQRLVARQNEMQKEFQEKLVEFLKEEMGDGDEELELPSAIGFQDLSPELQNELAELQKRMSSELKPLLLEQTLSMQKILEANDHDDRVELMRYFVDAERKRLQAKKTLKSMFGGGALADEDSETIVEKKEAAKKDEPKQQIFFDEGEDAFQ
ncbi:Lon-like domain-containing protein [Skeletonema marinoi]|uniref:Lon-like domain-containing protein n=1 Tax=Skeletonema marinoi TaxID=267567 RepID=A0AAD9D6D2_9STRA|nr:Lon-like domain-containing protein [Skeletonema marinoi]